MSKNINIFSYLRVIFLLSFLIFANACSGNKSSYINELEAHRKKNDNFYKYDKESPIPEVIREKFTGLNYFAPDENYNVIAKYIKYPNPDTLQFQTSKEDIQKTYLKYAKLEFNLLGKGYSLDAFVSLKNGLENYLFIPFTDNTNGKTSYDAGRYLDISGLPKKDKINLDFNRAYAPYCAYSNNYSCPLVPLSNHLDTDINAGEKKFSIKK